MWKKNKVHSSFKKLHIENDHLIYCRCAVPEPLKNKSPGRSKVVYCNYCKLVVRGEREQ